MKTSSLLALAASGRLCVRAFEGQVVMRRFVSLRAAAKMEDEDMALIRRFTATPPRRRARRDRNRSTTIDFSQGPIKSSRPKAPKRPASALRVDALLEIMKKEDEKDGASRGERVAAVLRTLDDWEGRFLCLGELMRLERNDLVRSCCASIDDWRSLSTCDDSLANPALATAFATQLCRAGLMDLVASLALEIWPRDDSVDDVADDERVYDEDEQKAPKSSLSPPLKKKKIVAPSQKEEDESSIGAPRPARFYSPLASWYLRGSGRQKKSAVRVVEAWRVAERAIRRNPSDSFEPLSVIPFNTALKEAQKARSLDGVFGILDAMAAAGVRGDDETFEIIGNVGARNVRFVAGAVSSETLPPPGPFKEAVFIGRSNVGKSSLVNMITNRRSAAFISKRPGKTQQFNYFEVNGDTDHKQKGVVDHATATTALDGKNKKQALSKKTKDNFQRERKPPWTPRGQFYLVDVPGLGFAEVPEKERRKWATFLEEYLKDRQNIGIVFHLVDSRHGPTTVDRDIWNMIHRATLLRQENHETPLRFAVALTKADKRDAKVGNPTKTAIRDELRELFGDDAANNVPIVATSAETRRGRDSMWRYLRLAIQGAAVEGKNNTPQQEVLPSSQEDQQRLTTESPPPLWE